MGVKLVDNENPFTQRVTGHRAFNMSYEVFFCARRSQRRCGALAGGHLEIGGEGQGALALIFKFAPLDPSWLHGMEGVYPFQSLNACFLVGTHHMNPLLMQLRRLGVQLTDRLDCLIKLFGILCPVVVQPVAGQVGLQIRHLLKNAPLCVAR